MTTNFKLNGVDLSESFNSYTINSVVQLNDTSASMGFKYNNNDLLNIFKFRAMTYGNEVDVSYNFIYQIYDTGKDWTTSYNVVKQWNGVACSYTGQYVISAVWTEKLYYSSDYGTSWTILSNSPSASWRAVSISHDGTKLFGSLSNDGIFSGVYYSWNSGNSWTKSIIDGGISDSTQLLSISCSANGSHVLFASSPGSIYFSNNSGYSFLKSTLIDSNSSILADFLYSTFDVKISGNGKYAIAAGYNGSIGRLYWSNTYGTSFRNISITSRRYNCVAISYSGQFALVGTGENSAGNRYRSSDFGQNWTATGTSSSLGWREVSMSYTGQYCLALNIGSISGSVPTPIRYSNNYGVDWFTNTTYNTEQNGHNICISGNGKIGYFNCIFSASSNSSCLIYKTVNTSTTTYSMNMSMGFEPLYIQGNTWLNVSNISNKVWTSCAFSKGEQYTVALAGTTDTLYYSNYSEPPAWENTSITGNISSCSINNDNRSIVSIYGGNIFYGTANSFQTSNAPTLNWVDVAISSSTFPASAYGNDILAWACANNFYTGLYLSLDGGKTWTEREKTKVILPDTTFSAVCVSQTSQIIIAATSSERVIMNPLWFNDGVWTFSDSPTRNWTDIVCSDTGQFGFACAKIPTVYELGVYNMSPWPVTSSLLSTAKWIWNIPDANLSAPMFNFMWFYNTFNSATANVGRMTASIDNFAAFYLNDEFLNGYDLSVNLVSGTNKIRVLCFNIGTFLNGNAAGLIMTIRNSSNQILINTDKNFKCQMANFKNVSDLTANQSTWAPYGWETTDPTGKLVNAKWIWATPFGQSIVNRREFFYKTFLYSQTITGNIYISIDNICSYFIFNDTVFNDINTGGPTVIKRSVSIVNGINRILICGYDQGSPAGLIVSVWNSTDDVNIFNSDSTWTYIDTSFNETYKTLYRTDQFGSTWKEVNASNYSYNKLAISSTGQYGLATTDTSNNLLYTKDYGENWVEVGKNTPALPQQLWNAVALSSTGKYAMAGQTGPENYSFLYYSTNIQPLNILTTPTPTTTPSLTTIETDNLYNFTTVGTYTISFNAGYNIKYLCVAGGGGGGSSIGAGGGAGGVLTGIFVPILGTSYTITVGAGGAGMANSSSIPVRGNNSSISTVATSIGGGGGAGQSVNSLGAGMTGGSGAGASRLQTTPGSGITGQGNAGGNKYTDNSIYFMGGGGGGAGGIGGNGNTTSAGAGGIGIQSDITGSNLYYGGGGGGQSESQNYTAPIAIGGLGGGGNGGNLTWGGGQPERDIINGTDGSPNTGGGGGASSYIGKGGNGGSGIVILRAFMAPLTTTPIIIPSFIGTNILYQFTTVGTYTVTFNISNYIIKYLCVAGGGAGGSETGGGGGAGGVLSGIFFVNTSISYTITVGSGGIIEKPSTSSSNGSNSSISTIATSIGGGGGAGLADGVTVTRSGGSGAGQSRYSTGVGQGTSGQGNNGGTMVYTVNSFNGGGGGGACDVGGNGTSSIAGNGGIGLISDITGTSNYYGGGGGGSTELGNSYPSSVAVGGSGGGGNGARINYTTLQYGAATAGTPNTGGGGGGGAGWWTGAYGGAGGSGIVILRAFMGPLTITPEIIPSFIGTDILYTFTTVGTYTVTLNRDVSNIRYLCVAGGGGGGFLRAGGGGAGGLIDSSLNNVVKTTTFTITVGNGGSGMKSGTDTPSNGGNSSITPTTPTIIAYGGGGGSGSSSNQPSRSNGGGCSAGAAISQLIGTSSQGFNGTSYFTNSSDRFFAGGGGGMGGSGTTPSIGGGSNGGIGKISNITGSDNYYCGGGGGAKQRTNGDPSVTNQGGMGGGGDGGVLNESLPLTRVNATNGTPNTGGGGGGGVSGGTGGGNGGSGIVILRVSRIYLQATNQTFPDTYATFVKSQTVNTDVYSSTNLTVTVSGATTYKNGLYSVSSSSAYSSETHPYFAFCKPDALLTTWASGGTTTTSPNDERTLTNTGYRTYDRYGYNASGVYQGATGVFFTTPYLFNGSFTTMDGEWIQISFPYLIKLTSITIHKYQGGAYKMPQTGVILGSDDGTIWNFIHNFSAGSLVGNGPWTYNISTTNLYTFIRFVINTGTNNGEPIPILRIKQIFYTGDIYTFVD